MSPSDPAAIREHPLEYSEKIERESNVLSEHACDNDNFGGIWDADGSGSVWLFDSGSVWLFDSGSVWPFDSGSVWLFDSVSGWLSGSVDVFFAGVAF